MILKLLHKDWKILQKEGIIQIQNAPKLNITRNKQLNISLSFDNYGWVRGWTNNENWLNYGLIYNYQYVSKNCEQCPQTFNILKKLIQLEKVFMLGFSLLKKGGEIPTHTDENYGIDNYDVFHLTLSAPSEGCELHVTDKIMYHREGELLRFKDFLPHSAINKSNHDRLILYIKIKKDGWVYSQ